MQRSQLSSRTPLPFLSSLSHEGKKEGKSRTERPKVLHAEELSVVCPAAGLAEKQQQQPLSFEVLRSRYHCSICRSGYVDSIAKRSEGCPRKDCVRRRDSNCE